MVVILPTAAKNAEWHSGAVSSLTKDGVTWFFDSEVQSGFYVNGDPWVMGPVNIIAISPEPGDVTYSGITRYSNGSMVNPGVGISPGQSYDALANNYRSATVISLPLTLTPGDSLVSTEGVSDVNSPDGITTIEGSNPSFSHCRLHQASVLTCVSTAPASTNFRPPFVGFSKPIYDSVGLQTSLLPGLTATAESPTDIEYYKEIVRRPWLTHNNDWTGRSIHPARNMPSYHREVVTALGWLSNLTLLESPYYDEDMIIYLVQNGIDWYHMCILGAGDSAFIEWPVLFAGLMLNDTTILNTFINNNQQTLSRTRDKCYFWSEHNSPYTSLVITPGETWTGWPDSPVPFWRQSSTTGTQEHEHLDPATEWSWVSDGGGSKRESYRKLNSTAWTGVGLSAIILGMRTYWDLESYFYYMDRWMTETDAQIGALLGETVTGYQVAGNSFIQSMWETYRSSY